jgi:hypothetical protein
MAALPRLRSRMLRLGGASRERQPSDPDGGASTVAVSDGAEVGRVCLCGRQGVQRRSRVGVCLYVKSLFYLNVSAMSLGSFGSLDLRNKGLRFNVLANICAFICSLDYLL